MIIEDQLQGEPPSKTFWFNVKRDKNDNPIMYQYVKSKWIYDNISVLRMKYKEKIEGLIDVEIHFILRTDKHTLELYRAIEFILKNVFIESELQIRNVNITKEISVPNNEGFKACIQNFKITKI